MKVQAPAAAGLEEKPEYHLTDEESDGQNQRAAAEQLFFHLGPTG